MTDRGRGDADGSARGTVTGGKGRSDRERDADADARKVVPFPREWYGSPDDLLPIDLGRPEGDATDAAGSDATEAAAFWEGGAGTNHEVADPTDARLRDPATSRSADQNEPIRTSDGPSAPKPPSRRSPRRPLAVVALLAVVLAGGAAVLVSGLGMRNGTDPRRSRSAAGCVACGDKDRDDTRDRDYQGTRPRCPRKATFNANARRPPVGRGPVRHNGRPAASGNATDVRTGLGSEQSDIAAREDRRQFAERRHRLRSESG